MWSVLHEGECRGEGKVGGGEAEKQQQFWRWTRADGKCKRSKGTAQAGTNSNCVTSEDHLIFDFCANFLCTDVVGIALISAEKNFLSSISAHSLKMR